MMGQTESELAMQKFFHSVKVIEKRLDELMAENEKLLEENRLLKLALNWDNASND